MTKKIVDQIPKNVYNKEKKKMGRAVALNCHILSIWQISSHIKRRKNQSIKIRE